MCQAMRKYILNVLSHLIFMRVLWDLSCYKGCRTCLWSQSWWWATLRLKSLVSDSRVKPPYPGYKVKHGVNYKSEKRDIECSLPFQEAWQWREERQRQRGSYLGHRLCCFWKWERCGHVCTLKTKNRINWLMLELSSEAGRKEGKNGWWCKEVTLSLIKQ